MFKFKIKQQILADCLLILFLLQKLEKLKKTPPDIRGLFTNTAFDKNATKKCYQKIPNHA